VGWGGVGGWVAEWAGVGGRGRVYGIYIEHKQLAELNSVRWPIIASPHSQCEHCEQVSNAVIA